MKKITIENFDDSFAKVFAMDCCNENKEKIATKMAIENGVLFDMFLSSLDSDEEEIISEWAHRMLMDLDKSIASGRYKSDALDELETMRNAVLFTFNSSFRQQYNDGLSGNRKK